MLLWWVDTHKLSVTFSDYFTTMAQNRSKSPSGSNHHSTPTLAQKTDPRRERQQITKHFLLVWLDPNVKSTGLDSQNTLHHLRTVISDIRLFTNTDDCVAFLKSVRLERVFVITSGSLGQEIVPVIHSMTHVDAIYIFCCDVCRHQE